jgi:hypothetical protein
VHKAIKNLGLRIHDVHELKECDTESTLQCFHWFQNLVHDGVFILHKVDFTDGWLHIGGYAD